MMPYGDLEPLRPLLNDFFQSTLIQSRPVRHTFSDVGRIRVFIRLSDPTPTSARDVIDILETTVAIEALEVLGDRIAPHSIAPLDAARQHVRVRVLAFRIGSLEIEAGIDVSDELRLTLATKSTKPEGFVAKALNRLKKVALSVTLAISLGGTAADKVRDQCEPQDRPLWNQVEQTSRRAPPGVKFTYGMDCGDESVQIEWTTPPAPQSPDGDITFVDPKSPHGGPPR